MDESDWLTSTDPQAMLSFLRETGRWSDRKARLFAAACCRGIWHLLSDERSRKAVEAAERLADAVLGAGERDEALLAACDAFQEADADELYAEEAAGTASALLCPTSPDERHPRPFDASETSRAVADLAGCEASHSAADDPEGLLYGRGKADECSRQCQVLRDLFGPPPFSPVLPPSVLAFNGGFVPRLAAEVYEDRKLPAGTLDPERLGVLADALEEAGADAGLIQHLRGPGPHVRGCHVIDAILFKG